VQSYLIPNHLREVAFDAFPSRARFCLPNGGSTKLRKGSKELCIICGEATEYSPEGVKRHKILSLPLLRVTSLKAEKRRTNSPIRFSVLIALRSLIQLKFCNSLHTVLNLNLACLYRFGTSSFGETPLSHLTSQKGGIAPSPTVMTVEVKKRALSVLSRNLSSFFQGLAWVSQLNQSQRRRRALPNLSKSFMPRPPNLLGLEQCF
jgi:hypothetical protein